MTHEHKRTCEQQHAHRHACPRAHIFIVSSPLKLGGGFLFLKFEQRRRSWKNCSEIEGRLVERGVLLERGVFPNCFISFPSEKHVFITIGFFFCLVNLFFHVVFFFTRKWYIMKISVPLLISNYNFVKISLLNFYFHFH